MKEYTWNPINNLKQNPFWFIIGYLTFGGMIFPLIGLPILILFWMFRPKENKHKLIISTITAGILTNIIITIILFFCFIALNILFSL